MNESIPAVSIIIPCRNEKDHIEACVRSIMAQDLPSGGMEMIVADGMSDDGTRAILAQLAAANPCLRVIDNPGHIVSTGLNAAIRVAQGKVIIRMDVHTEYAKNYVSQCVSVLQERSADNVGGPWVAKGVGFVGRAIAAAFQSPFSGGGAHGHDPSYEGLLDTVYLGCWRREVFEQIGFFDEELVRNQDDEFNLRLTRAGGKIWQSPRIKSWYRPRESLDTLFGQYMQYGYWKVRVIQKHHLPASVRHVVPGGFLLVLIMLPFLSVYWSAALWVWLGLVGTYGMCIAAASMLTAKRHEWQLLPLLPLVFACYHFAYGGGFLRGVWDFIILRRGPNGTLSELTRTSVSHSSYGTKPDR
jgi:succinoglycan biosynthesis protein ExoA